MKHLLSNPKQLSLDLNRAAPKVESDNDAAALEIESPESRLPQIKSVEPRLAENAPIRDSLIDKFNAQIQPKAGGALNANASDMVIDPIGFSHLPPVDQHGKPVPIPYDLKVSSRARQIYLRVEPGRGLQVTIPKRFPKRTIPWHVERQRKWIMESLADLDKKTPELYRQWPPPQLHLQALNTKVRVSYVANKALRSSEHASGKWIAPDHLALDVDTANKPLVAKAIAQALKARARDELGPWLDARSIASQLIFKKMAIRGQRTVWGTYSSSGTLSLNYKLLFLPANLVDYVLLHELAHIKHLDHSAEFWSFLESLKPNALALDDELQEAGTQVPPWLELVVG